MGYYNEYQYSVENFDALLPLVSAFLVIWGAVMLFVSVLSIALYVLRALSLQTIAKRRGLDRAWLSWIPVGQDWILGTVSDQYKYLTKGKNQSFRKVLLWLNVAAVVLGIVVGVLTSGVLRPIVEMALSGHTPSEQEVLRSLAGPMVALSGASGLSGILAIVIFVFQKICMYDLYKSCDPKNAVVFEVLGIVFGFTEPFFLLSCRNKDLGMPPRRAEPIPEPAPEPGPEL